MSPKASSGKASKLSKVSSSKASNRGSKTGDAGKRKRSDAGSSKLNWQNPAHIEAFNDAIESSQVPGKRGAKKSIYDIDQIITLFKEETGITLTERSVKRRLTLLSNQEAEYSAYKETKAK